MRTVPGTVRHTPASGQHEQLTLGRLLQERLLRSAAADAPGGLDDLPVTWCLPWDQVVTTDQPLAGIVVYARGGQDEPVGLRELAQRGAAALVVAGTPGTYAQAPGMTVPVLTVSETVTFADLSHLVAELSLARETHVLRYGLDVHRSLVELLYRGAGLDALCYQMARLSGTAAAIFDPQFRVIAFEQCRARAVDRDGVAASLRSALDPPRDLDRPGSAQIVTAEYSAEPPVTCVASPILIGGRHDGWVAVIESEDPPHPHDIAQHRVVVEQSATIVGTEMLRMRSIEQAEERARGDFVHALLHGRFATPRELEARAAHYKFPVRASYGVIVAGRLSAATEPESVTTLFQHAKAAARLAPVPGVLTLASVVGDVLAVIRQVDPSQRTATPDAGSQALRDYATALERDLTRRAGHPVHVAWGRPVASADRIFDSYREARMALGLQVRLGMQEPCGFSDLRVFATLAELADNEKAVAFAREMLEPLRGQRAGVADLEQSVITYIASGGNLNAAARELNIHRNTMLYKLERASRVLRLDLRQAEHQFAVWLAYKLDLLFEAARAVDRDVTPK